jgi:hypothetical protein
MFCNILIELQFVFSVPNLTPAFSLGLTLRVFQLRSAYSFAFRADALSALSSGAIALSVMQPV